MKKKKAPNSGEPEKGAATLYLIRANSACAAHAEVYDIELLELKLVELKARLQGRPIGPS